MAFLWPGYLFLLAILPLLIAVYIWMLRRRRRYAVRYSSLSLVRAALPRRSRWRRHVPFALFLLALASLAVAMARPVAITTIPSNQTNIILAIDVSYSMRQDDIQPTRLGAAQDAVTKFILRQKSSTQIGLVAFSGFAELIQPPTTDQEELLNAVDSLTFGRRTAIGSAILKSLDVIAEIDPNVAPSVSDPSTQTEPTPVPKGAYVPDIIVLLTDGVSNAGIDPLAAAQQAADRGVRVYTIGYGTDQGGRLPFDNRFGQNGNQGGNGFFGGGQQQGGTNNLFDPQQQGFLRRFRRGIDEKTLKAVADMTGGTYHAASSASELQDVFNNLPTYLILKHETTEISVAFAALGALLAAMALIFSLRWSPLP